MPKEITHWLVAEATMQKLGVERHYGDLLQLGAIFPDAPYYTLGKQRSHTLSLADRLHGASGEDTFEIVRACMEAIRQTPYQNSLHYSLRAFLLGVITHICTDGIFHPFVYFWSGNFHTNFHLAWRNHRALESALDLAFCKKNGVTPDSFLLGTYLRRSAPVLAGILPHLPSIAPFQQAIFSGYRTMNAVRRLSTSAPLGWLLDRIESALPMSWQFSIALRYTSLRHINVLREQSFRHPVTAEAHSTSFQALFDASVQESVRMWSEVERCLASGEAFEERGNSLEVGLVGVASAEMRYFAPF
jgi:hypothetical protein